LNRPERLSQIIRELRDRWSLSLGKPLADGNGTDSWVAPAERRDGTRAVLKIGMPHMEAADAPLGLRFWNGDPTVRLLESDVEFNAMLLERCEPGTALRERPEAEQDVVIAGLLRRLWRRPSASYPFRPLAAMIAAWAAETLADARQGHDAGRVREGLRVMEELSRPSPEDVLLATDLHAGNVLRARREPWLVIDPKSFVGDRAYEATQHLLNCGERLRRAPEATVRHFAELLEVDGERVRLWLHARLAADPDFRFPGGALR